MNSAGIMPGVNLISEPVPPVRIIETSSKDSLYLNSELSTSPACNDKKINKKGKQSTLGSLGLYIEVITETIRRNKWKRHAREAHFYQCPRKGRAHRLCIAFYENDPHI